MAKARTKKTSVRRDYAATEEDFEEAMKVAPAASSALVQPEMQLASNRKHQHESKGCKAESSQKWTALQTPARSRRRRSRSLRLSCHKAAGKQPMSPVMAHEPNSCDVYNLATAASQREALESWVLDRVVLLATVPTAAERELAALVAEVMLQKAEASSKLMASHVLGERHRKHFFKSV